MAVIWHDRRHFRLGEICKYEFLIIVFCCHLKLTLYAPTISTNQGDETCIRKVTQRMKLRELHKSSRVLVAMSSTGLSALVAAHSCAIGMHV